MNNLQENKCRLNIINLFNVYYRIKACNYAEKILIYFRIFLNEYGPFYIKFN